MNFRNKSSFSARNFLLTKENGFENFGALWSTDFCNLLAKSQAILLANYKNLSPKNPQNILNHFHCQSTKFLAENGSPLTRS